MCSHVDMVPYSDDVHHAFVFSTFADSLRKLCMSGEIRSLELSLRRALIDPSCKTAVAIPHDSWDEFLGWSVSLGDVLVYAYVRFPYRMSKIVSHVGDSLIRHVCSDDGSVRAALWTLDASRMAGHGYPIRYDLDEHNRFRQLAR